MQSGMFGRDCPLLAESSTPKERHDNRNHRRRQHRQPLARHLVAVASPLSWPRRTNRQAEALADELGPLARAASVEDAIAVSDVVVFAVWLDTMKDLIAQMRACSRTRSSSTPRTRSGSTRAGR